jgi:hypothetical protein
MKVLIIILLASQMIAALKEASELLNEPEKPKAKIIARFILAGVWLSSLVWLINL